MDSAPTCRARLFPSTRPCLSELTRVERYVPHPEIAHIRTKNAAADSTQAETMSDLGITIAIIRIPPISDDQTVICFRLKCLVKGAKKKKFDTAQTAEM